jgi:ABC-type transport system involved in multi-copper enzyme maturation permease subunit
MIEVFIRSVLGYRTGMAAVSIGLFLISLVIVYTFDAFGGIDAFADLFESLPESMRALFRAQGGFAPNANGYLAADYRHPIYLIAVSAFVISVAVGAVAREIERGSVLLVLSAPVERWHYLAAKAIALLLGVTVILAAALGGTWTGVLVTGITDQVDMVVFLRVQANTLALALAIGGLALVVSSRSSDGGQATGVTTAIVATMYFVDFLSLLWSPAEPLGPLTVFHYYDPLSVSQRSGLPWGDIGVLGAVAAVGLVASLVIFQRRDIAR